MLIEVTYLAPIFLYLSQSEKRFEIKPPLALKIFKSFSYEYYWIKRKCEITIIHDFNFVVKAV